LARQILRNRGKFYSGVDKLLENIEPTPARIVRSMHHHPRVFITEAGTHLVEKTIARFPEAADIVWLMREYYRILGSRKHPRLLDAAALKALGFKLRSI